MKINQVELVSLNTKISLMPKGFIPEYAFIGRSNVGKSSLINAITNRKRLALTSSKQGKTKSINHFKINNKYFIVDMPGYGYIKDNKQLKKSISRYIKNYILKRQQLHCLFLLIDITIKAQKIDLDFMNWLGHNRIPFLIIFTKSDKISQKALKENIKNYNDTILMQWEQSPKTIVSSSKNKIGIYEIIKQINLFYKAFHS